MAGFEPAMLMLLVVATGFGYAQHPHTFSAQVTNQQVSASFASISESLYQKVAAFPPHAKIKITMVE
jgi:hypothetical protein